MAKDCFNRALNFLQADNFLKSALFFAAEVAWLLIAVADGSADYAKRLKVGCDSAAAVAA